MTNTKKNKRWLSLLVAMMVIMSFSLSSVSAATNSARIKTFAIRRSGTYAYMGTVTIVADGNNIETSKTGTILFNTPVKIGSRYIESHASYKYKISSFTEGGKITLTYDPTWNWVHQDWTKLSGKIHINPPTGNNCHIWKIDSLGTGFYLREN